MASVYQSLIDMAKRLIEEKGSICTLRRPVEGNPVISGEVWKPTVGTPIEYQISMVILPEETINFFSEIRSLHESYSEGFEYALIANNGIKPSLKDVIIITTQDGTFEYKVRYSLNFKPAGDTILYIVGLKV